MAVTIKDIARQLGLSPSTVSRALHGHPGIRDKTKRAVRAKAREMDYHVNHVAAGLRAKKSMCLGVVVPDISSHFFSVAISGIQQVASSQQYQLLICQSNESEIEERRCLESLYGRVDGVLLSVSSDTNRFDHIDRLLNDVPVVLFDRVSRQVNTVQVEAEDYKGALTGTRHLLSRGCRKVAHLAGPISMVNAQNRLAGYRDALTEAGYFYDTGLVGYCGFDRYMVRATLDKLLTTYPDIDGIFAVNDELAVEAILALKSMGISIPDQVAVVGFGDYPIASIVEPFLTTVSHHPGRIGDLSARELLRIIDEGKKTVTETRVVPSELIIRHSA